MKTKVILESSQLLSWGGGRGVGGEGRGQKCKCHRVHQSCGVDKPQVTVRKEAGWGKRVTELVSVGTVRFRASQTHTFSKRKLRQRRQVLHLGAIRPHCPSPPPLLFWQPSKLGTQTKGGSLGHPHRSLERPISPKGSPMRSNYLGNSPQSSLLSGLRSKLSISTAQIKRTIPSSPMTRPETCPQPPSPASSRAVRRWERRLGPHSPKGRFSRRPEAGPGSGRRAPGPRPRKGAWVGAVPAAERRLQATPPPSRRQHAAPPGSAPSRLPPARRAHAWGGMEAAPRQPR